MKRIAFENVEDAFYDGCRLIELRFSPAFIASGKPIGYDEITEGIIDGITKGMNSYDIQVGLIGIASRGYPEGDNEKGLATLLNYANKYYTNSDDPQLMNIDLVHEYQLCRDIFGFGSDEFKHSFCNEDIKKRILKTIQDDTF